MIIGDYTKDHRIGKDLESAFRWQQFLIGKFDKIQIFKEDKRANSFINIKIKSIETLNSFMDSKNCEQFKQAWFFFREELASIRNEKFD